MTVYGETALHVVTSARPSGDVAFGKVAVTVGGPAAVVAAQLAHLGNRPALVSQVGADPEGAFILDALQQSGVDCGSINRAGRTGRIVAAVEDGAVELAVDMTGAAGVITAENLSLPATDLVYVTGFPSLVPVVQHLAANGHRLTVDLGFIPLLHDPPALMKHVEQLAPAIDVAIISGAQLNPADRRRLTEICFDAGASVVLMTLAEAGVQVRTRDQSAALPAVPVQLVDPLCAGDAFVGGFLSARARGEHVFDAAAYGQLVAAAKVSRFGVLPSAKDVQGLQGDTLEETKA
ncbi:carbohydrate kinase family protein [Kribbella sp. NPDC056345]|uniref:carbohydrate kinase family protein n=1 Tax=Kribbella sp. NPDC056345 TaxID=3345789 RepID=UPI0035E32FA0